MPNSRTRRRPIFFAEGMLHIWLGPLGMHLPLPKVWQAEWDWCEDWRKPPQ